MTSAKSEFSIVLQSLIWLAITLFFYFILRSEFLLWNWNTWFHTIPLSSISWAFLHGLRFDLSSLTWLSAIVLLSALLPWPFISLRLKERTLRMVFLAIHLPFLVLNILDLEFVHFAGRRMTPDSFYLLSEGNGKLGALWQTYWLLTLVNGTLLVLFYKGIQKVSIDSQFLRSFQQAFERWGSRLLMTFVILLGLILAARGGLQVKPLEVAHATALSSDIRLTQLTLNSSFTTIHSLQKKRLKRLDYFASEIELNPLLNKNTAGDRIFPWNRQPRNVVIFILESFGVEYTGLDRGERGIAQDKPSYTPFLDSLKNRSLYFSNSFANGRRSIEALPSILASVPSLIDEPFLTSPFQTNEVPSLGSALRERGVWSGFFHGGANGTMFFQEFTTRLGFTQYFGKNEYPRPQEDDDGTWGIWDGPFLNFFGEQLNQRQEPFLAVFFSLSSHHPFKVPVAYQEKLPKGPLPILQAVAYTDAMLKEFFEDSAKSPWFKDTLFIFTADHTSKSYLPAYQAPLESFRVPILLYFPGADLTKEAARLGTQEPVQHIDLLPTLEDLFALPKSSSALSRSLFQTGPRRVSLYLDEQSYLVEREQFLGLSSEVAIPASESPLLPAWKAQRQYFINGLLENKLFRE